MSYYRTAEHRRLRAELIRQWRPWEHSTGPRTAAGKAKVSRNADKGGRRDKLCLLARLLRTDDDRDPFDVYEEMERIIDSL